MASLDHVQRVFLGTDGPALHAAGDWLLSERDEEPFDLGNVLVVVPGGRAKRRLEELLAERAVGHALVPPSIITLGGLPERLLPEDAEPAAGRLETLLVWASVLREAEDELIRAVVPHPPARDDWPGWWALSEQVTAASDELGAHRLLLADVPARSGHASDLARWEALSTLAERYEARLREQGRADRHRARLDAIASGDCRSTQKIVLLGVADLQPIQSAMLACLDSPVFALVVADESDAEGFDPLGTLRAEYWARHDIEIDDHAIAVCDRPVDQAAAVLDSIRAWSEDGPASADQITIGLGDAALAGPIERTLALAGLPSRNAAGQPMIGARPVQLLKAIASFANGQRFDTLASLLRHPDAEAYVARQTGEPARPWLTLLDRYATDHLAMRPTAGWLGEEAESMQAVYVSACALVPDASSTLRQLHEWAEPIAQVLREVYGQQTLQRYDEKDRVLVVALEQLASSLQAVASIDPSQAPHCSFAQALALVVSEASRQAIPDPGGEAAIELVGYLELLLDDAPRLVITGMNEQYVPEPPRTSTLLSEGVRRSLGLTDDAHRLARDGYVLTMMLAWRDGTRLVAGKRFADGDPLLPSRLLLKADDDTLVQRVLRFSEEQSDLATPMMLTPGKQDRFLLPMPMPVLPPEPITSLRVTAFKDYLACPYRFYLKHILKLESLNDQSIELSAQWFGTLAHEALRILAVDDLRAVTKPDTIAQRLGTALDSAFAKRFGNEPPIAARVQVEQLRYRLQAYAKTHAGLITEGWRIEHEEKTRRAEVTVDGEPFTIRGQIDRIDVHETFGHRIIDYKTSDTAKHPTRTHLKTIDGQRQWVDLQLPLYLDLAAELGVEHSAQLGYINLPKKVSETRFMQADWGEDVLQAARDQRDFVIREVRAGVFWPPKQPPAFDDGLSGLCGDEVADRAALIVASQGGDA